MNRVLAAERLSEAQLVEARTRAEQELIEARSRAEADRHAAETRAAEVRLQAEADVEALRRRADAAALYDEHPALLRLRELETLSALAQNAAARLYVGFDKHAPADERE